MTRAAGAHWALIAVTVCGCRTSPSGDPSPSVATSAEVVSSAASARATSAAATSAAVTTPPTTTGAPASSATRPLPNLTFDESHDDIRALSIEAQQAHLIELVSHQLALGTAQRAQVSAIVAKSEWLGYGNPKVSKPAMTKAECRQRREEGEWHAGDARCGAPNMVAIESNDGQPKLCIDQYEFPNVACEYPVVWVRATEAAQLCQALGKRLCDAHEWEGACAGEVLPKEQEYPWANMPKSIAHSPRREQRLWMEYEHNRTREVSWAYGPRVNHALCGTGAKKESKCNVLDFGTCSTSSYPAGAFPQCVSRLGVYDQHGNAAEHMNLPLTPAELTGEGGSGWTEMKGSWFIFANQETHPDDCRWRAKSWHTTRINDWNSHRNYHLGFRCCRDVE